jgi:hypothetical protein
VVYLVDIVLQAVRAGGDPHEMMFDEEVLDAFNFHGSILLLADEVGDY